MSDHADTDVTVSAAVAAAVDRAAPSARAAGDDEMRRHVERLIAGAPPMSAEQIARVRDALAKPGDRLAAEAS